jgi:hypothetical protein
MQQEMSAPSLLSGRRVACANFSKMPHRIIPWRPRAEGLDMQLGKSFINCTEDAGLPDRHPWHPRMSQKLGVFRLVQTPGSHELCFSNPKRLALAIMDAGRD